MDTGSPIQESRELNQAAMRAMAAGDPAGAKALLLRALDQTPQDVPALMNLAGCCRALADVDGAMTALDGVLRIDPRNFLALLSKASLLERQGRGAAAATAYGIALSQAPPDNQLNPATLRAVQHGDRKSVV